MFITRLGQSQFLIKDKVKQPKVSIMVGQNNKELNNSLLKDIHICLFGLGESVSGLSDDIFLVNYPGEYDVKDVMIKGIQDGKYIIYKLDIFGEKIVYLEGLDNVNIDDQKLEQLGEAHVLIISISKDDIDVKSAAKIINRIEPRLVIPMNYKEEELAQFLKILGVDHQVEEESIQMQSDSLSEDSLSVKVLKIL